MNNIIKIPIASLGYQFIETAYLPEGKDEYYLRNQQNPRNDFRHLTPEEITALQRNGNTSDNWNKVLVSKVFHAYLVQNCKFFGLVRIGNLEPLLLSFSEMKVPVGLYNSTIISSDFGDNVSIHNNAYISHYIFGNETIIQNVNELLATPHAKFGNGIVKEGEPENVRIWLELCNENAGRSVLPFDGMLSGDAWLWSKYRDHEKLMQAFVRFTEEKYDKSRGYYGKIGDRTVIKNCRIIKDVCIGSDAYLKGANKIKNVTINSSPTAKSQVGEGCEIVNGIIGYGCRVFYGVKAVRFVMADWSQLKYGARLINSYLGSNATISCCEVLNSLIFPAHEQHHNNSFLCAALVMGQSNIAAGATIGSNHNSRSPDGELIAGRGFWPGLCTSLKHNSKFASYTILAKGDYPAELNIPFPFSLISNDVANDRLVIMPAYWFLYNMYALARNAWKYVDRDKRVKKIQHIEYDFLAPDTANEILTALHLLELYTGKALAKKAGDETGTQADLIAWGRNWLTDENTAQEELEIVAENIENTKRKTVIIKAHEAYGTFKELIAFYAANAVLDYFENESQSGFETILQSIPEITQPAQWLNVGGQLLPTQTVDELIADISQNKLNGWNELHRFYGAKAGEYKYEKMLHALACLQQVTGKQIKEYDYADWSALFQQSISIKEWMVAGITNSRAKDYSNPFRKMVYDTQAEMDEVVGKLSDNSFIRQEKEALAFFNTRINRMTEALTEAFQAV